MAKIKTVNVLESVNGQVTSLQSWTDNKNGNREAEELFSKIVEEYFGTIDGELLQVYIDDGYFSNDDGSYDVAIIHSY